MTERPLLRLAADPAGPVAETGQVNFMGTATTVLLILGFTILTDPNFLHHADRAYLGLGITTRRLTEPAMPVEQLPGLDFTVLPHHHGDHFDRIAARRLDHNLPVITEPHAAPKLTSQASVGRSPRRRGKRRLPSAVTTK
jgi:L-ascorbate metabolism protein UlaG (beta-lactamase superfamily)